MPRRDEFSSAQKFFQRLAENPVPTFERGQLLRSLSQFREKAGDAGEGRSGALVFAVAAGDGHGGAAGVAGLPADGLEQQRPAGDGFAMMIGIGQTDEQVPPIEHQRNAARHQAAALKVAGGEAAPAPLVLQLVETFPLETALTVEFPT